ncbi:MAG: AIR synthase-related protein, partial [Planctomycetota bacterium]|nr:AIR synthase-related protein [Planctomycetota bacterium]
MSHLNRYASETAQSFEIHSCTDITGFGLAGHLLNVATNSQVSIEVGVGSVPLIMGAYELCASGIAPGGLHRNKDFYLCDTEIEKGVDEIMVDLMFDPQTSGGLALFVEPSSAEQLLRKLKSQGESAAIIGAVFPKSDRGLILRK